MGIGYRLLVAAGTATLAVGLVAAPGTAEDLNTVTSFDGTPITFYWFPATGLAPGQQAPTVLQGPGFGGRAQSDPQAKSSTSIPGVGDLRAAGYNVLTWNPRGIAPSGGEAMLDNPDYEGRDVMALIDWVAGRPEARLDAPGDPRVGMTGGSYGGAIQLSTAGIDPRVDVIVPVIAWNSLRTSLYKAETVKTAWVNALMTGASQPGRTFSPSILKGRRQAAKGTTFTPEVVNFATAAGPFQVVPRIKAPTLLIQGTVDNLFPPSEAIANHRELTAAGTPVKMIWFCGGHGLCTTKGSDSTLPLEQTWLWLRKYLDGDTGVDTGAGFTWIDQRGKFHNLQSYPAPEGALRGTGAATLRLRAKGGSGPYPGDPPPGVSPLTWLVLKNTFPSVADKAAEMTVRATAPATVVGSPRLRLRYRGQSDNPKVRVVAQLVDQASGKVIGNQLTPIPLTLDGKAHRANIALEAIAVSLRKGQRVRLQIVAQSTGYDTHPEGGQVRFSRIGLRLPTVG